MAKVKEDISRVRLIVDGKQGINELGKLEMEAKELAIDLKNITAEQKKYEKESKNLDKIRERYDKLVEKARQLKEAGKQSTAAYKNNQKKIFDVTKELRAAQAATEKLKDSQSRYTQESNKLNEVKSKIKGLREELGITGMTLTQLIRHQNQLKREMRNTTTSGTADYRRLRSELEKVNGAVRTQRAELNGTKGFIGGMGQQLKGFGAMALGAFGLTAGISGLVMGLTSLTRKNAELSDVLSDVQKTTGLTDIELEKLAANLRTFDTRTPRNELLSLAEVAGRLGIKGVKDIEGFVRAADMINVSLGDALGDPEHVMKELGKLTETFGVEATYGIEDSLLKVGSAINELGMASTANEGYMVEFAKRMGGIAPLAKITIQDILGLGATLDSLGQTSEVSSTALSKVFISMAKNADVYAKYAGMQVADFVKLLNEDANEAFLRTLEGVKDNSAGITELSKTLGDLGENGGRVVGVLGSLANNVETVREQQKLANKAFEEGTSIYQEFITKNENFAANLAKLQKRLTEMFVNSSIMNGLNSFVEKWAEWVSIPVSETMEAERIELQMLHAKIRSTNIDTEERKDLIKELIAAYPDYLGKINADTVSNEGLYLAIKSVNDQLVNKIMLQKQDEDIMEQSEMAAEQQIKVFKQEEELLKQVTAMAEKHHLKIKEGMSIQEQANDIIKQTEQHYTGLGNTMLAGAFNPVEKLRMEVRQLSHNYEVLNGMEQENNALLDEKKKLMDRLGIVEGGTPIPIVTPPPPDGTPDPVDPTDPGSPDNEPDSTSGVPGDPEAAQKKLDELSAKWEAYQLKIQQLTRDYELSGMEDQAKELAQVQDKFTALETQLAQHLTNKTITEEQFREEAKVLDDMQKQEELLINQKYLDQEAEARVDAERKILEATSDEKDLALLKVNEHYDQLVALAKLYSLDIVAIEEQRAKDLKHIQDTHNKEVIEKEITMAEGRIIIADGLGNALGGMIDIIGNKSGELSTFQKVLVGAQIAMDTASALARIVPLAAKAASNAGPGAPLAFAGYIAAMGGIVLGAIGKAKKALSSADVPSWDSSGGDKAGKGKSGRGAMASAAPVASYYTGGNTSGKGMGIGDRYGEFTGYVHKDEYVVPSFIRSHPYVADVLPAIEAIRQDKVRGFYNGGETSKPSKKAETAIRQTDPEMISLLRSIDAKLDTMPTRVKAYLVDSEVEEFRAKRDMLKKKYVK